MWLVFVVIVLTSVVRNEVFRGTTNVVNWDGYGYYAYLPGIFIYGDVGEYAFAEKHFQEYDVSSNVYQLNRAASGHRFPIYNIGLSVIWAPAFLVTHGIVSATGIVPADGMSYPYQLMVVLMGLLFAFLGLLYLRRFLARYFTDLVVAFTLVATGLATNLFYYMVEKPDMTHGYLFSLYAIFLYHFSQLPDDDGTTATSSSGSAQISRLRRALAKLGLLAGLMCLVRSSEIVVFAIPAFYGLRNLTTLKRNFRRTLPVFVVALAVFSVQLVYYKIGTGSWWQNGYAGLGFDWAAPHLYEGLFGFRRGWLVYTPIMALALAGVVWLRREWFPPVLIFLLGNCYLLFSWHIWWYGNTFGSRPVVQSYALLALPLAALLAWVSGADAGAKEGSGAGFRTRILVPLLLTPFVLLNLFQHWQYNQRIIPLDFVNQTYYRHVFGKTTLDKHDYVYLDTNEKFPGGNMAKSLFADIDTLLPIPPQSSREFVNILDAPLPVSTVGEDLWLRTTFAYSYHGNTYNKWKFPGLVTEQKREGETVKWVQINIPRTTVDPAGDSLAFDLKLAGVQPGESIRQYFWNLSEDSMTLRNFRVRLLRPE